MGEIMYLLDTNICIALIQGHPQAHRHFRLKARTCYTSSLVVAELYKGVFCSTRQQANRQDLDRFLQILPQLDFDHHAALEFGKIQGALRRIGRPTGVMDALIAAVARSHQFTLVTHNTSDFIHIENLLLEDWLDELNSTTLA
jgi:tRNA(fMet)-specific endonuclease VapC